jgi:predicted adenine nucleotide alpha hydrolase (AANH) superfamily ATPase
VLFPAPGVGCQAGIRYGSQFTTTLLISPCRKHEIIRDIASVFAYESGVEFYYQDFLEGYRETFRLCRDLGLYHLIDIRM